MALRQMIDAAACGRVGSETTNEVLIGRAVAGRAAIRTVEAAMELTNVPKEFVSRYLNDGFSGGEKKRVEILQMAILRPELAIMDETDSGLDIDALRIVSDGVNRLAGPELGVLVITHYSRLLRYIKPNVVHVLVDGRIVRTGGAEVADELERDGYAPYGVEEEAIVGG